MGCFLSFLLLSSGCASQAETQTSRPNVLFILADDFGWSDVSYNGTQFYETPNIDQLAREGTIFTNGYASCQVCSPSRASIMTGKSPARHGITDWIGAKAGEDWRSKGRFSKLLPPEYNRFLPHADTSLAEAFLQAGYTTIFAGKWHLGGREENSLPEDHGFQLNRGGWRNGSPKGGYYSPWKNPSLDNRRDGENLTMRLADETSELISINHPDNTGKPFFAFLSFYAVHGPIQTTQEKWKKYREKAVMIGFDSTAYEMGRFKPIRQTQDNPIYAGLVESMDDAIGQVVKTLDSLELLENTIIVFTSDNGGVAAGDQYSTSNKPLRGGKGYQFEGGLREPFIISIPGLDQPSEINTPVIATDFYPTLLDFAGIAQKPNQHLDGVSLAPLLTGEKMDDRSLIWHYPHYGNQGGEPSSIIRKGDWKLIHYYEDERKELYNLAEDLSEQKDMIGQEPTRANQLSIELFNYLNSVGAKYPMQDSEYDSVKEFEYLQRVENELLLKLEQKRLQFLQEDFNPENNWWGSEVIDD